MNRIKVLLVDDDPGWIRTMEIFLLKYPDIELVGVASTKDQAINQVQNLDVDVVLMDINLSETRYDGIHAAAEISQLKQVKILMLTSLTEEDVVLNSFIAGAVNYFAKSDFTKLPNAIRETYHNYSPVEIALRDYARLKEAEQIQSLTDSERKVFELAEQGYTQIKISQKLYKSEQTIKNQIGAILKKLGVRHMKDAIMKVKTRGLLKPL